MQAEIVRERRRGLVGVLDAALRLGEEFGGVVGAARAGPLGGWIGRARRRRLPDGPWLGFGLGLERGGFRARRALGARNRARGRARGVERGHGRSRNCGECLKSIGPASRCQEFILTLSIGQCGSPVDLSRQGLALTRNQSYLTSIT